MIRELLVLADLVSQGARVFRPLDPGPDHMIEIDGRIRRLQVRIRSPTPDESFDVIAVVSLGGRIDYLGLVDGKTKGGVENDPALEERMR
jgi:hypothetical protein